MNADQYLAHARLMVARYRQAAEANEPTDRAAGFLVEDFDALDALLSAGGAPPEAWHEGPDAPELDADTVTIRYVIRPEYLRGELTGPAWMATCPSLAVALAVTGNRNNERFISADVVDDAR